MIVMVSKIKKIQKNRKLQQQHFDIRTSSTLGAGQGLFSNVTIKPGDTIGEYTGLIISDEQVEEEPYVDSDYVLWICKDCNIVGEGPLANYTRFINHCDKPNGEIVSSTRWKKARIVATNIIHPEQEIFIDYGPYYWETKSASV